MTVEVIANVFPALGKEDEVAAALQSVVASARENEPGCLRYQVYSHRDSDGRILQYVILEEYENHAAFENHIGSKAFNKAKACLEDQQLLAKALEIMFVDRAFGF
ncbi:hypothetical protein D6C77_03734 [Aureobasidium pullulans]|uniref:ABM domain-containing protein n=1 Tax=Aureobasidium pullulans TaxID=5580 RepID=A0A4S9UV19_AURPU|nr:hypothetical protein D6C90_05199 [Aureobasidium pullulans]TIA61027.1 hypothetical protein D6C77_03734 [Aureobasidium pullulans]